MNSREIKLEINARIVDGEVVDSNIRYIDENNHDVIGLPNRMLLILSGVEANEDAMQLHSLYRLEGEKLVNARKMAIDPVYDGVVSRQCAAVKENLDAINEQKYAKFTINSEVLKHGLFGVRDEVAEARDYDCSTPAPY